MTEESQPSRDVPAEQAEPLVEALAALAHEQWSGWMRYLFERCRYDDDVIIRREDFTRWQRQMKAEELDTAFNDTQAEWLKAHPMTTYSDSQHRYFFWAGSQFGLESGARIYRETFGRPVPAEVEGTPV